MRRSSDRVPTYSENNVIVRATDFQQEKLDLGTDREMGLAGVNSTLIRCADTT